MHTKTILIYLLGMFIFPFAMKAKNKTSLNSTFIIKEKITGIISATDGTPLASVTIKTLNSSTIIKTDKDGKFEIEVSIGDKLIISHIGFKTQEIIVNQKNLSIKLIAENNELGEVVVVGYGKQSKSTISGAIASTDLKGLNSRSLTGLGDVLQGKTPGVTVTNEGGDPTASPRINIRGMGGINGESPLYLLDGVIFPGVPNINPNDIKEISVLKDASAAIYGARASGGVILITTKNGNNGKLNFTIDSKFGIQNAYNTLQSLNAADQSMISNLAADNAGVQRNPAFNASVYPDGQITRTNWMNEIFRTAKVQDFNISANGGNEKQSFYTSFNYRNAEGILLNTYTRRYNFRLNSKSQLTPWLKMGENISYSYSNGNGANTNSGYTGAILSSIFYPRNVAVHDANGKFSGLPALYGPGTYGDVINPIAYLSRLDEQNPRNTILINPYIEIEFLKDLKFKSNFAFTGMFNNSKSFISKVPEIGKPSDMNSLSESSERSTDLLAEQTLNYTKNIGKQHFEALGGFVFQQTESKYMSITGLNFEDESPIYRYLVNAKTFLPATSGLNRSALLSYLVRFNYDFDQKYIISLIGRRDGSSLVPKNNRFQNYGSISAAWALHKENFLKNSKIINTLKLRTSIGVLGNLASLTSSATNPLLNRVTSWFGQTPTLENGFMEQIKANPNLTWARSNQINIGLDMGFLSNRLMVTADYYIKKTNHMLLEISLPGTTGVEKKTINGGMVSDKGIDLGITYSNKGDGDFVYNITASLNKVNNKVISLAGGLNSIYLDNNYRGILRPIMIQNGQALYSYYGLKTDGLFKTQHDIDNYKNANGEKIQPDALAGDLKFIDKNKDGKIDNDDRTFLGSAYPNFNYGLTFDGHYKNWDFNIFFQGVQGNKLFNALKYTGLNAASGQPYNMLEDIKNAFSPSNQNASIPRVSNNDKNGNFSRVSDFYIENGSFIRLKNIIIGYTFPFKKSNKIGLEKIRIYANASNLYTLTKYTGMDPEIGMDNYGMDSGRYPMARSFTFGLTANF